MKRLPILFSIVLLVVWGVAAQEKPICPFPDPNLERPMTTNPAAETKIDCVPITDGIFPSAPYSIMKESLVRRDGTVFNISNYLGDVVLLHTWATWSGPNIGEIPHLMEFQEKYKHLGLKVVALNIGNGAGSPEDKVAINKFAEKYKVNYELVQEVHFGKVSEAMVYLTKFDGVPQTILIDREGKLRGVFLGGGQFVSRSRKETVDKLMNEK